MSLLTHSLTLSLSLSRTCLRRHSKSYSKKREQELQEQLNAAQRDSQEKDQKCSKLEDAMYDMQKKMAVSRDDYEQQQELLVKLQQKCK